MLAVLQWLQPTIVAMPILEPPTQPSVLGRGSRHGIMPHRENLSLQSHGGACCLSNSGSCNPLLLWFLCCCLRMYTSSHNRPLFACFAWFVHRIPPAVGRTST